MGPASSRLPPPPPPLPPKRLRKAQSASVLPRFIKWTEERLDFIDGEEFVTLHGVLRYVVRVEEVVEILTGDIESLRTDLKATNERVKWLEVNSSGPFNQEARSQPASLDDVEALRRRLSDY